MHTQNQLKGNKSWFTAVFFLCIFFPWEWKLCKKYWTKIESVIKKFFFFISQPKLMLWVHKWAFSMRRFYFEHPKHSLSWIGNSHNFTHKKFTYVDLCKDQALVKNMYPPPPPPQKKKKNSYFSTKTYVVVLKRTVSMGSIEHPKHRLKLIVKKILTN